MKQYKITAKRTKNCKAVKDRHGKVVWDGKAKLITLTTGDEFVTKHMFKSMKTYTDSKEWQLKLVKVK